MGFTGQREDSRNGLVLFPARPYDPALGRFLQPDPFVQDPADPQTLNRYGYVRNNPLNLVDPSGYLFGGDDLLYWIIFIVVVAGTTYATWPFKEGFDPSILRDTGIRFLEPFTPPIIPPSITQQFSQAGVSIVQGTQALSAMNASALQGMASYAEPFAPALTKNFWKAAASKAIELLSQVNRVTTQSIFFVGSTQTGVFVGLLHSAEVTQPLLIFKKSTLALAITLLVFDLSLTSQSALSLGQKLLKGGIQTVAVGGAISAGLAIGTKLAIPLGATFPVAFGAVLKKNGDGLI